MVKIVRLMPVRRAIPLIYLNIFIIGKPGAEPGEPDLPFDPNLNAGPPQYRACRASIRVKIAR